MMIKHKFPEFSVRYFLNNRAKPIYAPYGNTDNVQLFKSLMFEVIRYGKVNSKASLFHKLYNSSRDKQYIIPHDNYFPVVEFEDVEPRFKLEFKNWLWNDILVMEMYAIEAIFALAKNIPKNIFTLSNFAEAHQLGMQLAPELFDKLLCEIYFEDFLYPELMMVKKLISGNTSINIFTFDFMSYLQPNLNTKQYEELTNYMKEVKQIRAIFHDILETSFSLYHLSYSTTIPVWYTTISYRSLVKKFDDHYSSELLPRLKLLLETFQNQLEINKNLICQQFVKMN